MFWPDFKSKSKLEKKLIMGHPVEKKMCNVLVTFEKKRNAFVNDTKNEP